MSIDFKTLTSVENEYLSKSGKKRRQRTLTDEGDFPIINNNNNNNNNDNNNNDNNNIEIEIETEKNKFGIKESNKQNEQSDININEDNNKVKTKLDNEQNDLNQTSITNNNNYNNNNFNNNNFNNYNNNNYNNVHVHVQQELTEIKVEEESDEDYDELEVIRQLSSIKLESDEDEDEDKNEDTNKDKDKDIEQEQGQGLENDEDKIKNENQNKSSISSSSNNNKNDKEVKIYNKKEAIDKKIKNKTKKRGKEPVPYLLDDSEVECVEDAVIYDESKDTEFPDLQKLFIEYNETYFYGKLSTVEVKWSNKMKLCAGICVYKRSGYCCIRLSLPLLKLRKIKEYRETLLHEMIHAFLFLTRKNSSHDGHGPEFKKHMYRINRATGLSISIYHSFHDEVNFYRNHVWRCTGPCRKHPPHFGYIKRSMNRPPGPKEKWWRRHASYCNGHFVKISSGENENNETKELKPGDMYKDGKPIINLKQLSVITKPTVNTKPIVNTKPVVKPKKNKNEKKRPFSKPSEILQDAIIILDSKDFRKKQLSFEETDIINLIKILFNDNKNKVTTIPDTNIDYKKPFEDKNYFEIDSD